MELIKGKIAALVNQKTMVINKGKKHGVTVDMLFNIKLNIPDISDPDDENIKLAGIYYTKGKLKVTSVYEDMSFASLQPNRIKYKTLKNNTFDFFDIVEEYPTVDSKSLISSLDWTIRIGDEIIQVEEEKKEEG